MEKNSRIVMRKKSYRAPNGAVLQEGTQESYKIVHPRDYAKNPPQGAELANISLFSASKQAATEIIRAGKLTEEELATLPLNERLKMNELRAQLEDFRVRFYAQFKRPDPEAPFEKRPAPGSTKRHRKQYLKLDTFIQVILRERLKKQ